MNTKPELQIFKAAGIHSYHSSLKSEVAGGWVDSRIDRNVVSRRKVYLRRESNPCHYSASGLATILARYPSSHLASDVVEKRNKESI
jgi:hypothetical protein